MGVPLLQIKELKAGFESDKGLVTAVDGVSFSVKAGETVGLVGESGCGKTVTALSILRLLAQPAGKVLGGEILFDGEDITKMATAELNKIRGARIGMVFQEPMAALNPLHRVGRQIAEVILKHTAVPKAEAMRQAVEWLGKVGIPAPEERAMAYPHQLSGGMRQRVVIAMALALKPALLIADEPTTALDVTIQAQILDLIRSLQKEMGMAVLLITHDLGVVAEMCREVVVMYAGKVVEQATVGALFEKPCHPYTQGLQRAIPRLDHPRKQRLETIEGLVPALDAMPQGCRFANRCPHVEDGCRSAQPPLEVVEEGGHKVACYRWKELDNQTPKAVRKEGEAEVFGQGKPLLEAKGLKMYFPVHGGIFRRAKAMLKAVDGVEITLHEGETLGLVGESGCGKSTLGKSLVRLYNPTEGTIRFLGKPIEGLSRREMKPLRRELQMIFQDPADSLNARFTVGELLEEPFEIHGMGTKAERRKWAGELLKQVGLPETAATRYPFEFSGGQRQRIGIARAIALNPQVIICDEPVSALDVSIQSQVLNLLLELQEKRKLTYLFIAHDLAVVKHVSDRIAVMYLGKIVELTDAEQLYRHSRHPYTRALLSAIPKPVPGGGKDRIVLQGDVPSPINPPSGCPFHPRCPYAEDRCRAEVPQLRKPAEGHQVACHFDLFEGEEIGDGASH